ncbi:MAG TPA: sugar phosphate nucleotidyltransferase [Planctomycetota bacterium]|nr:sugar phosphate nucleotidyltransferase [Planctomycetota bacterium]
MSARVVAVVAPQHERWWRSELSHLPAANVLVQPAARGTAPGILLPALSILRRDPHATIVVLPSDHHVADEELLHLHLVSAARASAGDGGRPVLLGIQPQRADTGYGWIVPARGPFAGTATGQCAAIESFVEKPVVVHAHELLAQGALWSSFMFAASAPALARLYERALPGLLRDFIFAMGWGERHRRSDWARDLYAHLPCSDFSRDVLQACSADARVIRVPDCGWSDLGTPERLIAVPGLRGPLVRRARALLASSPAAAGPDDRSGDAEVALPRELQGHAVAAAADAESIRSAARPAQSALFQLAG